MQDEPAIELNQIDSNDLVRDAGSFGHGQGSSGPGCVHRILQWLLSAK